MVVNTTNSRQIYNQLQAACPNPNARSFSPIRILLPTINERHEVISKWNRSLHFLLKRTHSAIDNLNVKFIQKLMQGICTKSNYASKSDRCTQIDKQTPM